MKKLEEFAEVLVGQIMSRVSTKDEDGETARVVIPGAINQGAIIENSLGSATLTKKLDDKFYTKKDDLIMKLTPDYDVSLINEDQEGLVISSLVCVIRPKDGKLEYDPGYLCSVLNSNYIKSKLISKAEGAIRPMIKVSDVRGVDIPLIDSKDQESIGKAYRLSTEKTLVLQEMINNEKEIMKAVVNNAIMEEITNE